MADVDKWVYSAIIKDHFMKPRGFLLGEPKEGEFDAYGEVGSLACGDIIKVWIKVDKETDKIKDFKWQTWGCATAIASASAFAEMIMKNDGMKVEEAMNIKPKDIADYLGGLPARKFHCSILADKAFKKAVENYRNKNDKKND